MKMIPTRSFLSHLFFAFLLLGCTPEAKSGQETKKQVGSPVLVSGDEREKLMRDVDALAERERAEGFSPGMALAESTLRERAGDFSGSVIAAFKELRWAYAMGDGGSTAIKESDIIARLESLDTLFSARDDQNARAAKAASRAAMAFVKGNWKEAREGLESLFSSDEEADSFPQWMILACRLEEGNYDRNSLSSYAAIRGRYSRFPEYWLRLARMEAGRQKAAPNSASNSSALAMDAAERCIVLSPKGPFAAECRGIMAVMAGLRRADGTSILTRMEIETAIVTAVNEADPTRLAVLWPLLSLQDNAYTLYALGAVRGLSSDDRMRTWLLSEASRASGRLSERLRYAAGR